MIRDNVIPALDACDISDAALVKATGCDRQQLTLVLAGKQTVEPAQAERLGRYFGTDAGWWLALSKPQDTAPSASLGPGLSA